MKKKNIANMKNWYAFTECVEINDSDIMELSKIYTLSALKHLQSKCYIPFIEEIRRTYADNEKAHLLNVLGNKSVIHETIKENRKKNNERKNELKRELKNIITDEERAELDEEYFATLEELETSANELDELKRDIKELNRATKKGHISTPLEDLYQVFRVAFLDTDIEPHEIDTRKVYLFGGSYVPSYKPQNKREEKAYDRAPTAHQLEQRALFEELTEEEREKAILTKVRIKRGQRAVNKYIRAQSKQGEQDNNKVTSYDIKGTDDNGKETILERVLTTSAYDNNFEDVKRTRAIIQYLVSKEHDKKLSKNQSAFIRKFATADAMHVEQRARSEYFRGHWENAVKHRHITRFYKDLEEHGYNERVKWAFSEIGIVNADRRSKIMKQLRDNLRPLYREIIALGERERAERMEDRPTHKSAPKRQNERVNGKAWVQHDEPTPTAHEIERAEYREKLKAWTIERERAELFKTERKTKTEYKPISEWNANAVEKVDRMEYTALWIRLLNERDNVPKERATATPNKHGARFYNPNRKQAKPQTAPSTRATNPLDLIGNTFTVEQ